MRLIRLLKNDLARESAEWVEEGILEQSQAELICERYGADFHQANNSSFAYSVLITLASLFMGVALILLIGENWEDIPRSVRMLGLIAITVVTQAFATRVHLRSGGSDGGGLFLLGNLFYGASIILIAQVYHLGEHMPDGIYWWALGSLPFALIAKNTWLMLFSLVLAIVWFFVEAGMHFNPVSLPLFIVASVWLLYVGRQSILLFLGTVFSIGMYVEYQLAQWWQQGFHQYFLVENLVASIGLFILAYAVSHALRRQNSHKAQDYAAVLSLWVLRFAMLVLIVLSFKEPWRELIAVGWHNVSSLFAVLLVLAGASLYLLRNTPRLIPVSALCLFYMGLTVVLMQTDDRSYAVYFQVLSNIVLLCSGIALIVYGINKGVSQYFFLGVLTILLTAFVRYVDLIGSYIGGALLFMFFAAVLLAAAKYWQRVNHVE